MGVNKGHVGVTWPLVGLVGVGLAAVVALLVWVPNSPEARSTVITLVAVLGPLITTVYTSLRLDSVEHKVNDNLSQLVEKVEPQRAAGDVREIRRHNGGGTAW